MIVFEKKAIDCGKNSVTWFRTLNWQIMIKRNAPLWILILMFIFAGCTNTIRRLSSSYQQQAVTVDASLEDWQGNLEFDPKSKLYYGIRHDRENVYIALQTEDPVVQRKIMAFGLTLWYDTAGAREQTMGVRYPVPVKEEIPVQRPGDEDLPLRARKARPDDSGRFLRTTDKTRMVLLNFDGRKKQQVDRKSTRLNSSHYS